MLLAKLADWHLTRPGSACFPICTIGPDRQKSTRGHTESLFRPKSREICANLSRVARAYLAELGIANLDSDPALRDLLWMHTLAIGHSPYYLKENEDGLKQGWPRVPPSRHPRGP